MLQQSQGETNVAVATFAKAAALGSDLASILIGMHHVQEGRLDAGIEELQGAIDRGSGKAATVLGELFQAIGDVDNAAQAFQKGFELGDEEAAEKLRMLRNSPGTQPGSDRT
jgi:predicted negative regulator of RcsB-dependent stress response